MNFILSSEWRTQFVILTVVSDWWTVSSDPWSQSVVSEINCRICAAVKSPSCNNYMQQQFCLKSERFSLDSECKQLKWFLFDVHWIEMERISNRHQQIWDFYQFTNRLNVISGVSRVCWSRRQQFKRGPFKLRQQVDCCCHGFDSQHANITASRAGHTRQLMLNINVNKRNNVTLVEIQWPKCFSSTVQVRLTALII